MNIRTDYSFLKIGLAIGLLALIGLTLNTLAQPATGQSSFVVSGRVFFDKNANSFFDEADSGTGDVAVFLYQDLNADGQLDAEDVQIAVLATDDAGLYEFAVASGGAYRVEVEASSLPGGHASTTPLLRSVFLAADTPSAVADFGHINAPFAHNQLIVRLDPDVPQQEGYDMLSRGGLEVVRTIESIDTYVLWIPPGQVDRVWAELQDSPQVDWIEPNFFASGDETSNDPDFADPDRVYAPQLVRAPQAWDVTKGAPSVVVAVVDSGLALTHPEFTGRIATGYDFVNNDNEPADDNGHGTHVAGIVAAALNNELGSVGIAPQVTILPVKVLDATNAGTWANIAAGIVYAADQGARVINLSLSGVVASQVLSDAVAYAAAHDALVVTAAGNLGDSRPVYPAFYAETLAVAATDAVDQRWSLSSYGDAVDISAPGVSIWSTYWTAADAASFAFSTGTSMAAPHVSAIAALLLSLQPGLSAAQVRNLIEQTAIDLGEAGRDPFYGFGRVDAAAALGVAGGSSETPTPTPQPIVWRMNAGGSMFGDGMGLNWQPDQPFGDGGYVGGSTKSSRNGVNGTEDDDLFRTWRDGMSAYRFIVPNGAYQVRLRFAEFETSKASDRIMRITIEDVEVESGLSIAGLVGKGTALDRTYVVQVTDGELTIAFAKNGGRKTPVVSAIEVIPAGSQPEITATPSPTPVATIAPTATPGPTPAPKTNGNRRGGNTGGSSYTDAAGQSWDADVAFSNSTGWGYVGGRAKSTSVAVAGTDDDALYQKWRDGMSAYRFIVPNGAYQVLLRFAEFETSKATDRIMRITMEGVEVESGLSIAGLVGKGAALDRTYVVQVTDGELTIEFARNGGRKTPIVSAIEVSSFP